MLSCSPGCSDRHCRKTDLMSNDWVQPTLSVLFFVIWLISFQSIVGERGIARSARRRPVTPPPDYPK
jgi:hypothetical protein